MNAVVLVASLGFVVGGGSAGDANAGESTSADCTEAPFQIGFSLSGSPRLGDVLGLAPPSNSGGDRGIAVDTEPSEPLPIYATLVSNAEHGVDGYALSIESRGDVEIVDASLDGTAASSHLGDSSFVTWQTVDPNRNGGRTGLVGAVVLCVGCGEPSALPPVGIHTIARIDVRREDSGVENAFGELRLRDGLAGKLHRWSYPRIRGSRNFVGTIGQHLAYSAAGGDEGKVADLMSEHFVLAAEHSSIFSQYEFLLGASRALKRLSGQGTAELRIPSLPGSSTGGQTKAFELDELRAWIDQRVLEIALLIDERNGNRYREREVTGAAASE